MSESSREHKKQAAGSAVSRSVPCAVLTVSDTRTLENDPSGDLIVALLEGGGHTVVSRALVPDEPDRIGAWLDARLGEREALALLLTGGTGVAKRDTTIEVVRARLVREMEGFGELFRMLSWEQVGASAMLSRACAGLAARPGDPEGGGVFVFAMPGSRNAVETAMTNLVVPELSHLVWERLGR
jgi:molybdopterin adenylyltransferase